MSHIALKPESFGGGLTATGFVTASEDVSDAALAVVCFSAEGEVLGGSWTNLLQNLTGGERKGLETVGGTPPMAASECATVEGFASDTGFHRMLPDVFALVRWSRASAAGTKPCPTIASPG